MRMCVTITVMAVNAMSSQGVETGGGFVQGGLFDSLDATRFSAMFSDGFNMAMFDRRGTERDIDLGARKRSWIEIKSKDPEHICRVSSFDMPFVHHKHGLDYLRDSNRVIALVSDFQGMSDFANVACLRYTDSGEDYYGLRLLESHETLANPRQSTQTVDVEADSNGALVVDELRMKSFFGNKND